MSRPRKAVRRFFSCRTSAALRRLRDTGDEGFTLIELAIVLVILPLIIGAVAVALMVTLSDQASVATRIADSVDSQITSAYFVRDVQSSLYVTKTSAPTNRPWSAAAGTATCGTGYTATQFVVSLAWPSGTRLATGATKETVVSYWRTQVAGGSGTVSGKTLTASAPVFTIGDVSLPIVQINGAAIPFGTRIKSVTSSTVATLTKTTSGGAVSFEVGPTLVRTICKGTSGLPSSTTSRDFFSPFLRALVSCVPSSTCPNATSMWVPAQAVTAVDLAVMEPSGKYNFNVSASPRVANSKGSITSGGPTFTKTVQALMLYGGPTRVIKEDATTARILVNGVTVMNTGYFQQTNGKFKTTAIWTTDTPPSKICTTPSTAKCVTITPPKTKAIHKTKQPDPFAGFTPPPASTVRPCPTARSAVTGVLTITPGQYPCRVKVGTGRATELKLNPGVYEFDTGITINGQHGTAKLTGMSGVFIYLPCKSVDGYGTPSCHESFALKNSVINVKALRTGPYAGMWFWQNEGDTAQVTLAGPGSFSVTGDMYVPGATVKLSGGGASSTVGAIIALTLWVHQGTFVITGK